MPITRLLLLACLLACSGPRPASDAGKFDGWEAVERDIAAAEARPEVCAKMILDGERVVVCCPRGLSFHLESRNCVEPPPMEAPAESPPPNFGVRLKELEACTQGPWKQSGAKSHGRCEDGKRFFETNGMHTGRADFYRGEQLVGHSSWSDVAPREHSEGDTGCKVIDRVGLCGTPLSFFGRTVFPASPPTE